MKLTRKQLRTLVRESFDKDFGPEFNVGYDQSIAYFGEGIVRLSQTTDIDRMGRIHQQAWLEKNCDITRIGGGSFRNVFVLNNMPEFVVKVAYTRPPLINGFSNDGRKFNKIEIEQFNRYNEMFPRTYAYDKRQYCWFIADREIPIEDEETLGKVSINTFPSFNTIAQQIRNDGEDYEEFYIKRMMGIVMADLLWEEPEDSLSFDGQKIIDFLNGMSLISPNNISKIKAVIKSDTKLFHFFNMIKQLKMNDLAYGNIGTNVKHDRLIILDHSAE